MHTEITKNNSGFTNEELVDKFVTNDIFAGIGPQKPGTLLIFGLGSKYFAEGYIIDPFYLNACDATLILTNQD